MQCYEGAHLNQKFGTVSTYIIRNKSWSESSWKRCHGWVKKRKTSKKKNSSCTNICGQVWDCREWTESKRDLNRERPQKWTRVGSVRFLINLLNFVCSTFNPWFKEAIETLCFNDWICTKDVFVLKVIDWLIVLKMYLY